jgi:hypothetical protein
MNIFIDIEYDISEPDKFKIDGNIADQLYMGLMSDFVRSQIGKGEDTTEPNILDVYHIHIEMDMSTDTFIVRSDTGNKGLRDGILMDILQRLRKR